VSVHWLFGTKPTACRKRVSVTYFAYPLYVVICWHDKVDGWNIWYGLPVTVDQPETTPYVGSGAFNNSMAITKKL